MARDRGTTQRPPDAPSTAPHMPSREQPEPLYPRDRLARRSAAKGTRRQHPLGAYRERNGLPVNKMIPGRGGRRMGCADVDAFLRDGYVAVRGAVQPDTAAACRELIWAGLAGQGIRRHDPANWPPLIQIDDLDGGPFTAAGVSPAQTAACDQLTGTGRRSVPVQVGSAVVVRFPSQDRANAGYRIEGSYRGPDGGYWVNLRSKARGLLALFLLTDVGPNDAPTRLVCGSHLAVPGFLARYGEEGVNADGEFWYPSTLCRPVAHAIVRAGDVFLCHPFLVHTATCRTAAPGRG